MVNGNLPYDIGTKGVWMTMHIYIIKKWSRSKSIGRKNCWRLLPASRLRIFLCWNYKIKAGLYRQSIESLEISLLLLTQALLK